MKVKILILISLLVSQWGEAQEMIEVKGNEKIASFYISRHEVTMEDFDAFVKATHYKTHCEKVGKGKTYYGYFKDVEGVNWRHDVKGNPIQESDYKDFPVTRINYYDALAYCKWKGLSLPTIDQWLYAANGGREELVYRFSGSNSLKKVGWFDGNSGEILRKIETKLPNTIGIYDMTGSVSELVMDIDIAARDTIIQYVGGNFFLGRSEAELRTVAERDGKRLVSDEQTRLWTKPFFGFRCVKSKRDEMD